MTSTIIATIINASLIASILTYRRKDRRKQIMSDAWTTNNDGVNLPAEMDTSQHSGEPEDAIVPRCAHDGGFTTGELPGGRKIKHCKLCGIWADIDKEFHAIGTAIGERKFGQ